MSKSPYIFCRFTKCERQFRAFDFTDTSYYKYDYLGLSEKLAKHRKRFFNENLGENLEILFVNKNGHEFKYQV